MRKNEKVNASLLNQEEEKYFDGGHFTQFFVIYQ